MGQAIGELTLHELGHGFKLDHTKKGGKDVQVSSPPLIMDANIVLDRSSMNQRDYTQDQKTKLNTAISKWMGISAPAKKK
jgi:hypothetical protein